MRATGAAPDSLQSETAVQRCERGVPLGAPACMCSFRWLGSDPATSPQISGNTVHPIHVKDDYPTRDEAIESSGHKQIAGDLRIPS